MINSFSYTNESLKALEFSISSDRLAPYLRTIGGDKKRAIQLYVWNMLISSTLYPPLHCLEVTLRNSIHRELSKKYDLEWYDNITNLIKYDDQNKIIDAKSKLGRQSKPLEASRIVAELNFGFWISLLGKGKSGNYEILWRNALHKAFPNTNCLRKDIHRDLNKIRKLRNRIAHHEPIHKRDLREDYNLIIKLIEYMCENTAQWIEYHNHFQEVYNSKPKKIIRDKRSKEN